MRARKQNKRPLKNKTNKNTKSSMGRRAAILTLLCIIFVITIITSISGYLPVAGTNYDQEPYPTDIIIIPSYIPVYEPILWNTTEPEPAEPEPEEPEPEPEPEPQPEFFTIVMMGDCTFAAEHNGRGRGSAFNNVVGDDYAYPFSLIKHVYEDADFVIVNFESAMSDYDIPADKLFNFNARSDYYNILIEGGVHGVTLGNNHVRDYREQGYEATVENLTSNGIFVAPFNGWNLYTTQSGLVIGVYSFNFPRVSDIPKFQTAIQEMKAAGAELIIVAPHWGVEGSYRVKPEQIQIGRAAVDAGAHIVMGTHPHTIQKTELYNGGVIHYSLANFVFGGNVNPRDQDSYIGLVTVKRDLDGTISISMTENIPVYISSVRTHNDFRPTLMEVDSEAYYRVLSKLDGTFTGADLIVNYDSMRPQEEGASNSNTSDPGNNTSPSTSDPPTNPPAETPPPDGGS